MGNDVGYYVYIQNETLYFQIVYPKLVSRQHVETFKIFTNIKKLMNFKWNFLSLIIGKKTKKGKEIIVYLNNQVYEKKLNF